MGELVAQVYWLAASVALTGILHMVAVKKDLWPGLKIPLDGGRTLGGRPIFGANKTWRGVLFMVLVAGVIGALQGLVGGAWAERSGYACIDFGAVGALVGAPRGTAALVAGYALVNLVLGLGYILGELPNSFIKRRIDIAPGKGGAGWVGKLFFVVDQLDSALAALFLGALFFPLGWRIVVVGALCFALLHFAVTGLLFLARIKREL
jgi:hypothetical protein